MHNTLHARTVCEAVYTRNHPQVGLHTPQHLVGGSGAPRRARV